MKIMHVIPYIKNESAGTTHVIINICKYLQLNGCEVVLYTLNPVPQKDYGFEVRSFNPSRFPHPALGRSSQMFKSMLQNANEFDIIHNHMLWMASSYYSGIVAKKTSKPYIIAPHGTLSTWALNRSKWKKKASMYLGQKEALDYASCFHVTATSECDEIKALNYKVPCAIVKNGIEIPSQEKLSKKTKSIVFISRIHPKKGLELLIRAWSRLEKDFQEWDVNILGPAEDQEYFHNMQNLVKEHKLTNVHFRGEVVGDEKLDYISKANLFVFPTYSENFGMVVAEALACATPVICTKGAPWERLQEKNAGWWVDTDELSITHAIKKALDLDENILHQMGLNGREWMDEEFGWDNIAKDMIETYKWMLGRTNKPKCVKE